MYEGAELGGAGGINCQSLGIILQAIKAIHSSNFDGIKPVN